MEKKRIRWFLPSKYHQEEDRLNRMAEQGWQLKKVSGLIYTFTDTEPAYTYRLALKVDHLKHGASPRGTIGFFVDIGTKGFFKNLQITPAD